MSNKLTEVYLTELISHKLSKNDIKKLISAVGALFSLLIYIGKFAGALSAKDVDKWLYDGSLSKLATATQRQYVTLLDNVYAQLLMDGDVSTNPFSNRGSSYAIKRKDIKLFPAHVRMLMDFLNQKCASPTNYEKRITWLRRRAFTSLLIHSCLDDIEISSLIPKREDGKLRSVLLQDPTNIKTIDGHTFEHLQEYDLEALKLGFASEHRLFVRLSKNEALLPTHMICIEVRRAISRAGFAGNLTPRDLKNFNTIDQFHCGQIMEGTKHLFHVKSSRPYETNILSDVEIAKQLVQFHPLG